jgi:hypothetical protein
MAWIPDSLSSDGGINGYCYAGGVSKKDCGQWWVYMAEEQMATTPEVFANEKTSALVQGGSNFIWMLTENHRRAIVDKRICEHISKESESKQKCLEDPQAVLPLGDLESFFINYMPNNALGKKHEVGRRPGYTVEEKREADRQKSATENNSRDKKTSRKPYLITQCTPQRCFIKMPLLRPLEMRIRS